MPRPSAVYTASLLFLSALLFLLSPHAAYAQSSSSSQSVTWTCTGSPCPWGASLSGQALVWPAELGPVTNRFGYTTSAGVYLPASTAAGMTVSITSGAAGVYAGLPDGGSHRLLAVLGAGQSYQVAGVTAGEVVSVQGDDAGFAYTLAAAPVPTPTTPPTATATAPPPTETPTATTTALPPTATATALPPTATATALPPTATATALPPTATATALPPTATAAPGNPTSQSVTWTCTGSPCPWGASLSGQALVWPAALGPVTNRFGYTTSAGVYLPANAASGLTIALTSGVAGVYAGPPDGSHRLLASLAAGQSYQVVGVTAGEVVSVQGNEAGFAYTLAAAPAPTPTTPPTATPTALPPTATATALPPTSTALPPTATATALPPTATAAPGNPTSQSVTWTCTGSPCPWGASLSGQALVWPAALGPVTNRFGYTTSAGVYLPANTASGLTIALTSGVAGVYAGLPDSSHRLLASLAAGQSYQVVGVTAGEVVSVQGNEAGFAYTLAAAPVPTPTTPPTATPTAPPATGTPPATATPLPTATATPLPTATATPLPTATQPACTAPATCNPVTSVSAYWRCNIAGCTDPDWVGAVINWPAWAAYDTNARAGVQSRTVYSAQGEKLYPYMGSWANGCQVTAVSGTVMIIEWKRGTNFWREIFLAPGQTHTITLIAPEDGAMIESPTVDPFSVSLANCNPQNLATLPTPTPAPAGEVKMGETNILSNNQSGLANLLVAQQATLSQGGALQSLSFYVTNPVGQVVLGVYNDNGGRPGTLVAQTAAFTPATGWNTQNVSAPASAPAGTYWLAVLAQSNDLTFRGESTGQIWGYSQPFGAMPATPPAPLGSATGHWSFYATVQTQAGVQMQAAGDATAGQDGAAAGREAGLNARLYLPSILP